uniref:Uncharacterized protein n=1 Tax=Plectus sambesii TaxID=2011161 RepID=A0A914VG83_9BILA
ICFQRELTALKQRVSKYELAEQVKSDKEEEFKRKEREMQAQMRQKEAKLRQVRSIFEGKTTVAGPAASNHFGSTDSINRVASQRFGGSTEVLSAKKTGGGQQANGAAMGSTNTLYPTITVTSTIRQPQVRGRVGPDVPPKPGFANTKYHRRSKSATGRIIDHQPTNKVPAGMSIA